MAQIHQQALVLHSAEQMYDLVADIESYPEFLRYCTGAALLAEGDDWVEARLDLARGPVQQSFTTRNTSVPGRRIDLNLVQGPFSALCGTWLFEPMNGSGCRIRLNLEFELRGALKFIVTPLITEVANQLLDAVIKRADCIYPRGA